MKVLKTKLIRIDKLVFWVILLFNKLHSQNAVFNLGSSLYEIKYNDSIIYKNKEFLSSDLKINACDSLGKIDTIIESRFYLLKYDGFIMIYDTLNIFVLSGKRKCLLTIELNEKRVHNLVTTIFGINIRYKRKIHSSKKYYLEVYVKNNCNYFYSIYFIDKKGRFNRLKHGQIPVLGWH